MDLGYTWIYLQGNICRQVNLAFFVWTLFIGQVEGRKVRWKVGDGVNRVDNWYL